MPFLKTVNDLLGSDPYVMEPEEVANMQDALREARERIQRVLDAEPEEMKLLFLDFRQMLEAWEMADYD